MTQPPTLVQRLKSFLGYQLWALLVWVPLCWVVIIPATTAIDDVLRGTEGSSVSHLFATFSLLVILKHWTGLAIVLRIDFLVSLQVKPFPYHDLWVSSMKYQIRLNKMAQGRCRW